MVGQVISFSAEDFPVSGGSGGTALAAITLKTLPDIGTGMLTVGGQPLTEGALVDASGYEELKAALDHCHDILGAEGDLLLSQGSAGGT